MSAIFALLACVCLDAPWYVYVIGAFCLAIDLDYDVF
jgi:hypothetical protein